LAIPLHGLDRVARYAVPLGVVHGELVANIAQRFGSLRGAGGVGRGKELRRALPVARHTVAAEVHAGEIDLSKWETLLGRLFVPADGFTGITRNTIAALVACGKIVLRPRLPCLGCLAIPLNCLGGIFRNPSAEVIAPP